MAATTPSPYDPRHATHPLRLLARRGWADRTDRAARREHDGRHRHRRWRVPRALERLQLKALEPEIDVVVLEAGLAGNGPSGRNGGFVSTLWDDLPILRDRVGDERAVAGCRVSGTAVRGIGAFCGEPGGDGG